MTKGTHSAGKKNNKSHTLCIRCGRHSYHMQKSECSSCGYPAKKLRKYNWAEKSLRRRTTGTGRTKYLRKVHVKAKNNFRESRGRPLHLTAKHRKNTASSSS